MMRMNQFGFLLSHNKRGGSLENKMSYIHFSPFFMCVCDNKKRKLCKSRQVDISHLKTARERKEADVESL